MHRKPSASRYIVERFILPIAIFVALHSLFLCAHDERDNNVLDLRPPDSIRRYNHHSTSIIYQTIHSNVSKPTPPGWKCIRVRGRAVLYSIHSATIRNILRCRWWKPEQVLQSCDEPDVIILVPRLLLGGSEHSDIAALRAYVKTLHQSPRKQTSLVYDDAGNYGVSMLGKSKINAQILLSSIGVHQNDSSILVAGMGALGEPCRREFNIFWTLPCSGLEAYSSHALPDKRRRFLCLGGYPRTHKVFLLSKLWARGALKEFAWSAGTPIQTMADIFVGEASDHGADVEELRAYMDNALPHVLDVDVGVNKQNGASFVPAIYQMGSVHLVLESDYKPTRLRYTEKTIKAIYTGVPFIILASPGVLELLKSHGFRTFHPHINETYDSIVSYQARSTAIADEVGRLLALSTRDFAKTLDEMSNVAMFNQRWLMGTFLIKAARQSRYAFGVDEVPGFNSKALNAGMSSRGGPRTPYNC
jgi:hypothetical protein